MGSEDERKKKKKEKKKDKKKSSRDRKERDRSRSRDRNRDRSDDDSSDSESIKRKKKPRKSKSKQTPALPTPHKYMYPMPDMRPGYPFAPPPFYMPMMGDHPITPPPPTAPPSQSLNKAPKTKEPNIFKLLPMLSHSLLSFCTTTFSTNLAGQDVLEQVITRMWKNLDRRARTLGVKRISKLVSEGLAVHEKLINKESKVVQAIEQKPTQSVDDFELLTALYNRAPISEIVSKITPECILTLDDFIWPAANPAI